MNKIYKLLRFKQTKFNKPFLFLFIILLPLSLFSQKEKKLINDGKFSQAHELLIKSITKDSLDVETNFYLSILFIQETSNDFFSIKLSHNYYLKAKYLFNLITDNRTLEKLNKREINKESIFMIRDSIFNVGYRNAKSINNEQAYIEFIQLDKEIPDYIVNEAITRRNSCAFEFAKKSNTINSYESYLLKYPNSNYQLITKELIDSLAFEKAKENNTILDYKKYFEKYIDSKFCNEAKQKFINLVYAEVKKQNTISSYELFIEEYPNSIFINEAKNKIDELLYSQIIKENSVEKCYTLLLNSPQSIYKDSVNIILENLKYNELLNHLSIKEIEKFNDEFQNSKRKNKLLNTLDSLYYIVLINSNNIGDIQFFLKKYPTSKHYSLFEKIIASLTKQKNQSDFNNLDLFIHPNYFEESTQIKVRNISFLDKELFNKLESTTNRSYFLANKFVMSSLGPDGKSCQDCGAFGLGTNFKILNNNWYFFEDKLFKNYNGLSRGIQGGDKNSSNSSRLYTFNDSIVIDGNGYVINLFDNSLYTNNSCKVESLLKINKINSSFEKQKKIYNKHYEFLPNWANNPNYVELVPTEQTISNSSENITEKCSKICVFNDSLLFLTLPIGFSTNILEYPINKKIEKNISIETFNKNINDFTHHIDDTDDIGYRYFFRKYNLIDNIPFVPNNINLPKNDAFVITEFNHNLNKLNIIYDASLSGIMPVKLMLDKTNSLLIIQSVDSIKDNYNSDFSNRYKVNMFQETDMHYSITIIDIESKKELLSFPGLINDLTDNNRLILNAYKVWNPKSIYYDELDLNELILNKNIFKTPKIETSLQIDEFMTNFEFQKKINLIRKENKYYLENQKLNEGKLYFENIKNLNNKYNATEFLNSVKSDNNNICDCVYNKLSKLPDSISVPLNYLEYELDNKQLKLESNTLNDFLYQYMSEVNCDSWIDINLPCKYPLSNGFSYYSSTEYSSRKFTLFLNNVKPEVAKQIRNNVKIFIEFNHELVFNPEKIEDYYKNPLVRECVESNVDFKNEKISELFKSYEAIKENYEPYAKFYILVNGEKFLIKYR